MVVDREEVGAEAGEHHERGGGSDEPAAGALRAVPTGAGHGRVTGVVHRDTLAKRARKEPECSAGDHRKSGRLRRWARMPHVTGDHYFSAEPASVAHRRTVEFSMAGRDLHARRGRRRLLRRPARPRHRRAAAQGRTCPARRPTDRCWTSAAGTARSRACWPPWRRGPRCTPSTSTPGPGSWRSPTRRPSARPTGSTSRRPTRCPRRCGSREIWSNPPIRIGKPDLHELLPRWLPRLRPGRRRLAGGRPAPRRRLAAPLADRQGWQVEPPRQPEGLPGIARDRSRAVTRAPFGAWDMSTSPEWRTRCRTAGSSSPTCRSASARAPRWRWSGRTAPARRRCCGWSPATCRCTPA